MVHSAGHVFILRGDIRRLACDAWALPADGEGRIEPSWVAWPPGADRDLGPPTPFPHWTREGERARKLEGWPAHLPEAWLLHVELDPTVPGSWLVEEAVEFVERAAAARRRRPRHGRSCPLLALPVGVAGIGAADGRKARRSTGALVRELLPELRRAAARQGVDVALVAHSEDSLLAAQAARAQDGPPEGADLPPALAQALPALQAAVARAGLVLVCGPALAERSGQPGWSRLLERLAEGSGAAEGWRGALGALPEDERTRLVARQLGGSAALGRVAAERLASHHHGLAHGLLAGLQPRIVVSAAPDDQLEQALVAAGGAPNVLLDGPARAGGPPLLRMAGSPHQPASLVWARVDADWRRERESGLRTLAQAAMPLEPHVLVVGVHEGATLLRTLRELLPALPSPAAAGGQLTVLAEGAEQEVAPLLPPATCWAPLSPPDAPAEPRAAGRHLELLLDQLGAASGLSRRFLDPGLRGLLSPGDQALARALEDLLSAAPERARKGQAWTALARWMAAHGHDGE
ncbi:hypothetical protein L6R53_12485 [Myxococcota bacterium]|nr:hypothetical protein [Myxococcota bacterium]